MAVWPEGRGIIGAYIDENDRQRVDSTSRLTDQFVLPTWAMKECEGQYAEFWPHAQQRIVFFGVLFRDRPLESIGTLTIEQAQKLKSLKAITYTMMHEVLHLLHCEYKFFALRLVAS
jgi:hypothetical protein